MKNKIIDKYIELAGSQTKLAEKIGASQGTISLWKTRDFPIPSAKVIKLMNIYPNVGTFEDFFAQYLKN